MIFLVIIFLVLLTRVILQNVEDWSLWLKVFVFYTIYMTLTNLYVKNPLNDYFVSIDQLTFYASSLNLSNQSFSSIVADTFGFKYNQTPLSTFIFTYLLKFARLIGVENDYYFLKLMVVYVGSLVFPLIAKITRIYDVEGKRINRSILVFAFLSPILLYSCQLLRDAHICLLYTILFYVALKPKCRFRWILLVVLIVISYYIRPENGLFALLFIALALIQKQNASHSFGFRFVILTMIVVGVLSVAGYVYGVMMDTLTGYTERSISLATEDSLGVRLNYLPFPFDILSKTLFGQILPFPCWAPLAKGDNYAWLRIIECAFPFYWPPILLSCGYVILKKRREFNTMITITILVCFTYIILSSASTFDTRRVMAVYPALFSMFLVTGDKIDLKKTTYDRVVFFGMAGLYIIYFLIK